MTKEDAIKILNDYDINFERNTAEEIAEAHEMAIEALKTQPNEDCITDLNGRSAEEIAEAFDMAIKSIQTIPSEDEKIIRIKKGTLKARTGRFVIYDVEWLKTHFNTTEAKIYGKPKAEGARGDIPLQQSVPKMPQPSERTEERTETHECDYINGKGHWIEHKYGGIEHIECPKCKCWFLRKDLIRNSYCPNCGSRNHWEWELKTEGEQK